MKSNKQARLLLTIILILIVFNMITLVMLIRKPDQSVINKLEEAQVKLDTVSVCLDKATNSLDSVIVSLGRTGLKAAALDREVNAISRSNEIRKTASGKQINEIRSKIQDDQQKLQLLQKELKTLK